MARKGEETMKLFPASGWFAVLAQREPPYRRIVPIVFWALDGDVIRAVVPGNRESGPGPALSWADDQGDGSVLVGYYHQDETPKSQIQSLVEEALVLGAKLATASQES